MCDLLAGVLCWREVFMLAHVFCCLGAVKTDGRGLRAMGFKTSDAFGRLCMICWPLEVHVCCTFFALMLPTTTF